MEKKEATSTGLYSGNTTKRKNLRGYKSRAKRRLKQGLINRKERAEKKKKEKEEKIQRILVGEDLPELDAETLKIKEKINTLFQPKIPDEKLLQSSTRQGSRSAESQVSSRRSHQVGQRSPSPPSPFRSSSLYLSDLTFSSTQCKTSLDLRIERMLNEVEDPKPFSMPTSTSISQDQDSLDQEIKLLESATKSVEISPDELSGAQASASHRIDSDDDLLIIDESLLDDLDL